MGDLQDQGLMDAQWTDALSVDQLAELLSRLNVVYELVLSPCPLSSPGAALETLLTEVLSNQEPAMTRLKLLLLVGNVAYADCSMEEKEVAAMLRCDYHNWGEIYEVFGGGKCKWLTDVNGRDCMRRAHHISSSNNTVQSESAVALLRAHRVREAFVRASAPSMLRLFVTRYTKAFAFDGLTWAEASRFASRDDFYDNYQSVGAVQGRVLVSAALQDISPEVALRALHVKIWGTPHVGSRSVRELRCDLGRIGGVKNPDVLLLYGIGDILYTCSPSEALYLQWQGIQAPEEEEDQAQQGTDKGKVIQFMYEGTEATPVFVDLKALIQRLPSARLATGCDEHTFDPDCTHIVAPASLWKLCVRFYCGIANGCCFVTRRWILDSATRGCWLDESDYKPTFPAGHWLNHPDNRFLRYAIHLQVQRDMRGRLFEGLRFFIALDDECNGRTPNMISGAHMAEVLRAAGAAEATMCSLQRKIESKGVCMHSIYTHVALHGMYTIWVDALHIHMIHRSN
jgi:hypothetical protein